MDQSPDSQFLEAFTESQSALRGYCLSSIGNPEDAKDVFQKTCLALWKKSEEWNPEIPFLKWAFSFARFEVLAHLRDAGRDRLVFDEDVMTKMMGSAERIVELHSERSVALEICLQKLKPEHRDLLTDFYIGGYSMKEISQQTNRGLSAIKVMMMRLRNTLATCIEEQLAL